MNEEEIRTTIEDSGGERITLHYYDKVIRLELMEEPCLSGCYASQYHAKARNRDDPTEEYCVVWDIRKDGKCKRHPCGVIQTKDGKVLKILRVVKVIRMKEQ